MNQILAESKLDLQTGGELVMRQGALIATLPIQEWLDALDEVDTVAPITNPTLYKQYLASSKPELLKDVLKAALLFKLAIVAAQEKVLAHPERF